MGTKIFDLVTLTLTFDLLLKKFNLGHSFLTRRGRVFVLHMYIPCDNTFSWMTLWPWPWHLTYFYKTLTLAIVSSPEEVGLSYNIHVCTFLVTRHFHCKKKFDLVTLTFDLLSKNFNLGHSFLTRRGRAFILHMCTPCHKTFPWIPKFWPSYLDLEICPTLTNF